jgi:hypothetical protein
MGAASADPPDLLGELADDAPVVVGHLAEAQPGAGQVVINDRARLDHPRRERRDEEPALPLSHRVLERNLHDATD